MARPRSALGEVDTNCKQQTAGRRRKFVRSSYEPVGKENRDPDFAIFDDELCAKKMMNSVPSKDCIEVNAYTLTPPGNRGAQRKGSVRKKTGTKRVQFELPSDGLAGLKFV